MSAPKGNSPIQDFTIKFLLCAGLILFAVAFSIHSAWQLDLPWQIRTGYDIVSSRRLPHADPFSWTRQGTPWAVNEWLTFVIYYSLYKAFSGFAGIWILQTVLACAISISLFATINRITKSTKAAFLISLLAIISASRGFQPRPILFTDLLMILTVGLCVEVRRGISSSNRLWLLPFVFAIWANLHQGVVIGVGILGFFAMSDAVEAVWRRSQENTAEYGRLRMQSLRFLIVAIAGFLGSLLTPYHLRLYGLVFSTVTDPAVMRGVAEWRPLSLTLMAPDIVFLCFTGACIYAMIRYAQARSLGDILIFTSLLYEAFAHQRNQPIFVLASAVLLSPGLTIFFRSASAWTATRILRRSKQPMTYPEKWGRVFLILLFAMICAVLALFPVLDTAQTYPPLEKIARYSFETDAFPTDAVNFLRNEQFPATMRLYNDYDMGGILVFGCPSNKVFVDGRDDIYKGDVLDHVLSIDAPTAGQMDLKETDKKFLRSFDLDCAFTENRWVAQFFAQDPQWTVVYYGVHEARSEKPHATWIFVRNRPQFAGLILRCRQDFVREFGDLPASGF